MREQKTRKIQKRIRIQIPQNYRQDPILSNLVSQYGLDLNISAALLDAKGTGGGWFDLQLGGTQDQIKDAIIYLSDLNIQMWHEGYQEETY